MGEHQRPERLSSEFDTEREDGEDDMSERGQIRDLMAEAAEAMALARAADMNRLPVDR